MLFVMFSSLIAVSLFLRMDELIDLGLTASTVARWARFDLDADLEAKLRYA